MKIAKSLHKWKKKIGTDSNPYIILFLTHQTPIHKLIEPTNPLKQSLIADFAIFAKDLALWCQHSSICDVKQTWSTGIVMSYLWIVFARANWRKGNFHYWITTMNIDSLSPGIHGLVSNCSLAPSMCLPETLRHTDLSSVCWWHTACWVGDWGSRREPAPGPGKHLIKTAEELTHWTLGNVAVISKVWFSNSLYRIADWTPMKLFSGECHKTSQVTNESTLDFMPSGNNPWPEPMLTKIYVAIWHH